MPCLSLRNRWPLKCWLCLWVAIFVIYMFMAKTRNSKNRLDLGGLEAEPDFENLRIAAPSEREEKSFREWEEQQKKEEMKRRREEEMERRREEEMERRREEEGEAEESSFRLLLHPKVTTVNNLCIQRNDAPGLTAMDDCVDRDYSLVIYNSGLGMKRILHGFNVTYKTVSIPQGYQLTNQTAFFHGFTKFFWPDNFYHFTKQFYFPLHHLINGTNSLMTDAQNAVFFAKPYYPCISAPFTNYFFPYLNIENGSAYAHYPGFHKGGLCFKNAVFSNDLHLQHAENAIVYIRDKLGAKQFRCAGKHSIVFLRRRKNRKIANALSLKGAATRNGFKSFGTVFMEDLTMQEQMQTMMCADVMIGVQGAGLQWAYFMRPLSVVVEIAWPNFGWNFFYSKLYTKEAVVKRINFLALETNDIANKTECLNRHLAIHRPKIILSQEQKMMTADELFTSLKPTYPGKTCDVKIDEKLFLETLKKASEIVGH